MNLHLLSLRASGPDAGVAEFEVNSQARRVSAEFSVDLRDGIATAAATPDLFRDFDGTAEEQRQIVAAVVAFCQVSSRESER